MTTYPNAIDNISSLPLVYNNISPIVDSDVNRIRNAVVEIQRELGVNPSGTFADVKARLNSIDITTDFLSINIEAGTDRTYTLIINSPLRMVITSVTTQSAAGTATATLQIDGYDIGGDANAVSTTEVTTLHAEDNIVEVGGRLTLVMTDTASAEDIAITVSYFKLF